MRAPHLLASLALASALIGAPALALGGRQDPAPFLRWKGALWTSVAQASGLPEPARAELAGWESWCQQNGYQAVLDDEGRVLLLISSKRKDLPKLAELARKTTELFDRLAPAPARDPAEKFLVPDWGRGQHVPDRDLVTIALVEKEPDFESALGLIAATKPETSDKLPRDKAVAAFFSSEARTGVLLSAPDGYELGTVWRAENELVNRLTRLLLHRRFGKLPYWLDMGLAWHVEQAVQGDLYSFPGRDDFVSVQDHSGWKNELKREFKKRKQQPLSISEIADWRAGTWDAKKVAAAWGLAQFLATDPAAKLSAVCEDLRLDVKENGVKHHADGRWDLIPDYSPSAETQDAILARHLGPSYREAASEYFRAGKRAN